jgi:hypothetical protein
MTNTTFVIARRAQPDAAISPVSDGDGKECGGLGYNYYYNF